MSLSIFDMFRVGVGPSSSHTVGPMRAARMFTQRLHTANVINDVSRIHVRLLGSLGATGTGHGTIGALLAGLAGADPETVDPATVLAAESTVASDGALTMADGPRIEFHRERDITSAPSQRLEFHSNALIFSAFNAAEDVLDEWTSYSVGGGFVLGEEDISISDVGDAVPHDFTTAASLLSLAHASSIADVMLTNERTWRSDNDIRDQLLKIWAVMAECVDNGQRATGTLPGRLHVRRRAATLREQLLNEYGESDPLGGMEWVSVYAMAVNEENAAGGRVVTAPTNGAAGIIPAVITYMLRFTLADADATTRDDAIVKFLLTAGAVGILIKHNSSISGAEVGCQGEVGSACAMAAAGFAAVLGGTPEQVENAAEIGIEHNLGLTCDPIDGLVQIPCIERNGMGAVKAITAARIALRGDGIHHVSLDSAIETMRATGADMLDKYKETSLGGLAVAVVEC